MSQSPQHSIPKQCPGWSDLKAAYRFLSNPDVDPHAIQQPHRCLTLEACAAHDVVLCIQDTTELDFTRKQKMRGRGQLGNGNTQGLLQHSALALKPDADRPSLDEPGGQLLGVLHQCWYQRIETPEGETLRQLQSRRTNADVWAQTASAIAELGATPTRLIHVGDRHCDMFRFFDRCRQLEHGFVVRAMHNRLVRSDADDDQPNEQANQQAGDHAGTTHPASPAINAKTVEKQGIGTHDPEATDENARDGSTSTRLWSMLEAEPIAGHCSLTIHEQRTKTGRVRRQVRQVNLAIRHRMVMLPPPQNDPRTQDAQPLKVYAVYAAEQDAPDDDDAVHWMLLSSEPINDANDALRIIGYYRHRWVIEEWHRVLKEGCKIEAVHFDDTRDVQRLAAIKGVIALRMLQLRDLADQAGDDPKALQRTTPTIWRRVIAALTKCKSDQLTPRQFYLAIAKQGGYIGRTRDPRPGWKVLWQGWYDIQQMVRGAELMRRE